MSLLSEEEIEACAADDAYDLAFARAIEAAILKKLASAELPPLPDYECGPHTGHFAVRTDESIRAYGLQAHAQGFAAGAAAQLSAEPVAVMHRGELCIKSTDDDQSFGMLCPTTISEGTELYTRREAK